MDTQQSKQTATPCATPSPDMAEEKASPTHAKDPAKMTEETMSPIDQVLGTAELFGSILHYFSPKELAKLRSVSQHWDNFITSSETAIRQAMHLKAVPRHEYIIWNQNLLYAMSGYKYQDNRLLNLEHHNPSPTTEQPPDSWPRIYRSTIEAPIDGSKRVLARLHDFFTLSSMYGMMGNPANAETHLFFSLPPEMVNLTLAHSVSESFVTQPPADSLSLELRYRFEERYKDRLTLPQDLGIPGLRFTSESHDYGWGDDWDTLWYNCELEKDSAITVGDVITFLRAHAVAEGRLGPSKLIEVEGEIESHFPYASVWVSGARDEVGGRVVVDAGVPEKVSESEWRPARFDNFHGDYDEDHVKRWEDLRRIALAEGRAWPGPPKIESVG